MAHFKLNLEHSTRVIHHMEPIVDAQQKQLQLSSAFEDKRNPSWCASASRCGWLEKDQPHKWKGTD